MNIVRLISSFREKDSYSIRLGDALIDKLKKENPVQLVDKNFTLDPPPYLQQQHIQAFATPIDQLSDEQKLARAYSDQAIEELLAADVLIVEVPMCNFTIPATLKSWIDQIARSGITFRYTEKGAIGLLQNKKVYLIIASGGVYSDKEMQAFDFTESYLKYVFQFMGITDIVTYRVEGTAIPELKNQVWQKALKQLEEKPEFTFTM